MQVGILPAVPRVALKDVRKEDLKDAQLVVQRVVQRVVRKEGLKEDQKVARKEDLKGVRITMDNPVIHRTPHMNQSAWITTTGPISFSSFPFFIFYPR
jgi:translation initiation factor 2B subunit (eIF-2B alpha/beta/delta family)